MSNIYIQEPPAAGKVVLKTSAGDIDIELWTKEAPKACRNFIQLCMEGYYNGTIFHRVVPNFIVQGGDPNGDGTGGESIYGEPFKDEFHSRLRFNRRGLVACANAGKDDNGSQFFFTLGATPELQNKHTIFGKVTGETVFNMLKLAEGELDMDDKPLYPKKIIGADVLINPFTDIIPRKNSNEEKREAKAETKKSTGVKNFGLLSFGEEAEEDEEEMTVFKGKPKSTHDLLDDPKLSRLTGDDLEQSSEFSTKDSKNDNEATKAALSSIRDKLKGKGKEEMSKKERVESDHESDGEYYLGKDKVEARKKQAEEIRNQIKDLKKEMAGKKKKEQLDKEDKISDSKVDKKSSNELMKQYEEDQDKYRKMKEKIPKKGHSRKFWDPCYENGESKKKPWVKNLYENKDYADNYTDVKFLEQMKRNVNMQTVTFFDAFLGSCRLTQKLSTCVLFAVLFTYLYNDWIMTKYVFTSSCVVTVIGYILYLILNYSGNGLNVRTKTYNVSKNICENFAYKHNRTKDFQSTDKFREDCSKSESESAVKDKFETKCSNNTLEENMINDMLDRNLKSYLRRSKRKEEKLISRFKGKKGSSVIYQDDYKISCRIFSDLKTVLIYIVFGYIVSPILHTLTDTVSTDTIFATTSLMMLIHLIFSDYGVSVSLVSNSLSINAAIFGSICLASRLSTAFHAFVLITVAVQCFFLLPILIKFILPYRFSLIMFMLSIFSAFFALWYISNTIFYIYLVTVLFLNVYCPYLFVLWQKYKDNIYGPWDEAVVHDSDDVDECIGTGK